MLIPIYIIPRFLRCLYPVKRAVVTRAIAKLKKTSESLSVCIIIFDKSIEADAELIVILSGITFKIKINIHTFMRCFSRPTKGIFFDTFQ